MVKVKLEHPVLSPDHEVWMVRPGAKYRLAKAFAEVGVVAPDIPLLDIPDGTSASASKDLDQQIRRGREWRDWEKGGAKPEKRPSRSLEGHKLGTLDGSFNTRLRNEAIQIFDRIPEGAVIFVPGASLADKALIGTAAAPSDPRAAVTRKWAGGKELSFLGRRLLQPIAVDMRTLPISVADMRKNRGVTTRRITGDERTRLYREYFKSFSIEGGDTFAQFRGGNVPFPAGAVRSLSTLAQYFIEVELEQAAAAAENRQIRPIDPDYAAHLIWTTDEALLIHARVNSPFGKVTLQSVRTAIRAATVFVALASLNADAQVMQGLSDRALPVENVCENVANQPETARLEAEKVAEALYDFRAIFGARTCEGVLKAMRRTVEISKGSVDVEAER